MDRKGLTAIAAALMLSVAPAAYAQTATPVAPTAPAAPQTAPQAVPQAEPQAAPTSAMSENEIRSMLEERGMAEIADFERDGVEYTTRATWFGEEVDVRVDTVTGMVVEPEYVNEDQVTYLLEEEGYSEVSGIERDGEFVTATAERDDAEYKIRVDARSGAIIEEEEA